MEDWVLETIRANARPLLALARRHSLCAEDAQDAYQRSLELFVARLGSFDPVAAPLWLRTTVRREALALRDRRLRERAAQADGADVDGVPADGSPAHERAGNLDRLALAAEALAGLRPDAVRALVMRAAGHSLPEISRANGWSRRKAEREVWEGRRAFRDRVVAIDSGAECERWAPLLSSVADGAASDRDLARVRPHLRNCSGCRATLRAYREAPASLAALVPAAAGALPERHRPGLLGRVWDALAGGWHERAAASAARVQAGADALTASKAGAVALSATALAGGGVAVVGHRAVAPRATTSAAAPPAPRPARSAAVRGAVPPAPVTAAAVPRARARHRPPPVPRRPAGAAAAPAPLTVAARPSAPSEFAPEPASARAASAPAPPPEPTTPSSTHPTPAAGEFGP
jgi:DNA-directed RNA polymerase specialized sigma24 family protein